MEVAPEASNAFLRKLERLIDTSNFPAELDRPQVKVDFNPRRRSRRGPPGA